MNPVVMRSSPATDIYAVYCWLSSPNKLNLLSWLLTYICNKYSAWLHQHFLKTKYTSTCVIAKKYLFSEENKIPQGHNVINCAVQFEVNFKVEIRFAFKVYNIPVKGHILCS